jgi:hypothetical protein
MTWYKWNPEKNILIMMEDESEFPVAGFGCVCATQPKEICAYHSKLKELLKKNEN